MPVWSLLSELQPIVVARYDIESVIFETVSSLVVTTGNLLAMQPRLPYYVHW